MDFRFTEEQNMLRASVRGELDRIAASTDNANKVEHIWQLGVAQGWTLLMLPAELDGLGLGLVDGVIFHEALGQTACTGPFAANSALLAGLQRCGIDIVPDKLWQAAATGKTQFALGEIQNGRVVTSFPETARHVILVDLTSQSEIKFGLCEMSALTTVERGKGFDVDVAIATAAIPEIRMARADPHTGMAALGGIRLLNCAEILGLADQALAITLDYVKDRKQFDKPIGSFQAIKHALANAFVALENGKTALYHAAWQWDQSPASAVFATDAARARIGRTGIDILHTCIQAHGGIAFTWDYGMHGRLRRIRRLTTTLGTIAEAKRNIARELLGC